MKKLYELKAAVEGLAKTVTTPDADLDLTVSSSLSSKSSSSTTFKGTTDLDTLLGKVRTQDKILTCFCNVRNFPFISMTPFPVCVFSWSYLPFITSYKYCTNRHNQLIIEFASKQIWGCGLITSCLCKLFWLTYRRQMVIQCLSRKLHLFTSVLFMTQGPRCSPWHRHKCQPGTATSYPAGAPQPAVSAL